MTFTMCVMHSMTLIHKVINTGSDISSENVWLPSKFQDHWRSLLQAYCHIESPKILHRLLVHKQIFLLVVLDLSKVGTYTSLKDKDMLESKDPQVMRIEQYFLMTDYSLWEVILNGDSPIPIRVVDDKHQLKFNIHKDAKSLMEAIEKRFGGNKETKKVQKILLKQQYENFTGSREGILQGSAVHLGIQRIKTLKGGMFQWRLLLLMHSIVFNFDDLIRFESDVSMPTSPVHDMYKSGEGDNVPTVLNVKHGTTKPNKDLSQLNWPSAPIIEDWVSDSEDKSEGEPMPPQKAPSFVQTFKQVKTPRPSVKLVEHPTPAKNLRKDIPKHVVPTAVLTRSRLVSLTAARPATTAQALKDKGVIDNGFLRHMTRNISYLSDFEEINRGYVTFGGNLKGGKITGKDPQNKDSNAAFNVKENESEVHVSLISSDKQKIHDKKAKRKAKGKSPVELSTGVRDLSDEFEEFSDNRTNGVNADSTPVTAVGQNSTNNTNSFSVAGTSNTIVSLTFTIGGKSLFMDPSQYHDDPNMPALEDITFPDDEEDVAAQTRSMAWMVKEQEPKRVHQALKDPSWIEAMQKELFQFKMQKVWVLVDLPKGKRAIGLKWGFRNKKDKRGIVIRNKACSIALGYTHKEGIDYKEVFTPVAMIEAIRLFLAYDSFMGFMVYQMDVKSTFVYGIIEEEVYVCQPPGFKDPDYPDKVYKVVKALYGLHQALRAWYETLANYLLENGFQRGKSDQTLFGKKQKGDILLVQVYVDDIIFGSTNKDLCNAFEKLMKDKF
nr:putative ribonuclease H-like domain-containing protein [Tanacetum cinerariifolium]